MAEQSYKYELSIDYPKSEWAQYVANTLSVDKELRPKVISKKIQATGNTLNVVFSSSDLKMLRTVVSSFYDFLLLATNTLNEFATL
jgi:tRNA threonylcarbamoyladenosine modification (KEOPS) complex  Pcc1 subunit